MLFRSMGMHQGASRALKAKVVTKEVDQEEEFEPDEGATSMKPEEYEVVLRDYVALATRAFWKNPAKAKVYVHENTKSSKAKENM